MLFYGGMIVGATTAFWITVWLLSQPREDKPFHEAVKAAEDILHENHRTLRR